MIRKIRCKLRQIYTIIYYSILYGKRIKFGKHNEFRKGFKIIIEKNGILEMGDYNFFNHDCSITCLDKITIGDGNLFGENVKIYDHNHVFNKDEESLRNNFTTKPIHIGNNNWIGSNCVILKNASMNNRNVLGAGVILNEQIDSYKIVRQGNKLEIKEINKQQTTNNKQQTTNNKQQTTNNKQQTTIIFMWIRESINNC